MDQLEDQTEAEWLFDLECPCCLKKKGVPGMVARDKFGIFCVIKGCGWKESNDYYLKQLNSSPQGGY